ncbi:MAG: ribosome-binding factor A [Candidatus Paceibacterota bacterium]
MARRKEQVAELLKKEAAAYLNDISPTNCLVTVTNATISSDYQHATIYITVFPDEHTENILTLTEKNIYGLKEYMKSHTQLSRIPWLTVELDRGEKHRQRIDELSRDL